MSSLKIWDSGPLIMGLEQQTQPKFLNAMFALASTPSNIQNMCHMGNFSNWKMFKNTFPQQYSNVHWSGSSM